MCHDTHPKPKKHYCDYWISFKNIGGLIVSTFFTEENLTYLYGWLRYSDIASANSLLNENRDLALSASSLLFISPVLKLSSDGNFGSIAKWFLDNHRIPENVTSFARALFNKDNTDDSFAFNEKIEYCFFDKGVESVINNIPSGYGDLKEALITQIMNTDVKMTPIMVIFGTNYYLDLLYPIMQFIIDTVSHIKYTFEQFKSTGASLFLRQTAPCKFLSQLEVEVADSMFDTSFFTLSTASDDITGIYPADVETASPFRQFNDRNEIIQSFNALMHAQKMQLENIHEIEADGFVSVIKPNVSHNIDHVVNTVSTYTNANFILNRHNSESKTGELFVDKYWGFTYQKRLLEHDFAIYGNENLPVNFSEKTNGRYLRVPFRKIPCIMVSSQDELIKTIEEVKTKYQYGWKILFRGQGREYYLTRNENTLRILYNENSAHELSLLPSSARSRESFEDIYPTWSIIVNHFKHDMNIHDPHTISYMRFMLNMSLAQHYGLPSCGLDLTDDIGTALFFALNKYVHGNPSRYVRKLSGESVIYILECDDQDTIPYSIFNYNNEISHPRAQNAYFFHTGWGFSSNRAARQVRAAIYFDASITFSREKTVEELFPADDSFAKYIKDLCNNYCLPESIKSWLDRVYYIEA